MLYDNVHRRVLHIHIPRTGGRTVSELLRANDYTMCDRHQTNKRLFDDDMEFLHATEKNYRTIYGNDVISIAVVRNPLDRFISASRMLKPKLLRVEEWTEEYFESLFLRANATQWIRRQADFITAETRLWKYEDGLGKEFCEWLREECKIEIEYKGLLKYSRFMYDERPVCYNDALLEFAESYYRIDIEMLGYATNIKI